MYVDWSSDGCPNNCGYCKKYGYSCIYEENSDSPLKKRTYTCAKCHKPLAGDEAYNYKGFCFCEKCLDYGRIKVEKLIKKAYTTIEDPTLQDKIRNGEL